MSKEVTAPYNGSSALAIGTSFDNLTFVATDNTISGIEDNGIAVIAGSPATYGSITINNNTLSEIENLSSGIAISQDFETLDLTVCNNVINNCAGSGIFCYTTTINSLTSNISDNTVSNCQNLSSNAASGISIDGYVTLAATVKNNTLLDNATPSVAIGFFTGGDPNACLTLNGNNSNVDPSYYLMNPGSGVFNISPCNIDSVNVGEIDTFGTINPVQSCSHTTPCP